MFVQLKCKTAGLLVSFWENREHMNGLCGLEDDGSPTTFGDVMCLYGHWCCFPVFVDVAQLVTPAAYKTDLQPFLRQPNSQSCAELQELLVCVHGMVVRSWLKKK